MKLKKKGTKGQLVRVRKTTQVLTTNALHNLLGLFINILIIVKIIIIIIIIINKCTFE